MKKIIKFLTVTLLILAFMVSAVSCANSGGETDTESDANKDIAEIPQEINIATLNGTTGFGIAKLMSDRKNDEQGTKYNFSVESDASVINASLINGSLDIATLPTNAAANLYAKTDGKIQILAVNTLGVLYVVANEANSNIKSLSDLEGKTVYCPAQNPYFIFKGLCDKAGVNVTIDTAYSAPADLRAAVVAGKVDIAVLPEPMVTIATSKNTSVSTVIDVTAEWNKVFPENSLMQGCIVARTEFINRYPETVKAFLEEYKSSVEYVSENPSESSEIIAKMGIFEQAAIAKKAIPKCNVKYIDGKDMADALDVFFGVLYDIAPASIGGEKPDRNIYYIAD